MISNAPRIMISAAGSNNGKTTVTSAILKAFTMKGKKLAAFKAGPDYIDPMFHSRVIKVTSRNLDKFMMGENNCKYIFSKNSNGAEISIIEGVMGYYDGIGTDTSGSSYELAAILNCPVVLVINPNGMAASVCAIIEGFKSFREKSNIKGVILNGVSNAMYEYYRKIIESNTNVRVYGYMPRLSDCMVESRHLGLVTAEEIGNLESIIEKLGEQALRTIDLDGLYLLAASTDPIKYEEPRINYIGKTRIAVAYDKAFCFYYEDNLDILAEMGAEVIKFSPLKDKELPGDIGGLYIGGGYPELYVEELSGNKSMLDDIKSKVAAGLPTFAECGGYMYLMENFIDKNGDKDGKVYSFAGAIEGNSCMTGSLKRFGYITLTSRNDNLMCKTGESINGHEFHYSDSSNTGDSFLAAKPESDRSWMTIIADDTKFVGYPHINFMGNLKFAENFMKKSIEYYSGSR